jgi:manganese/zinc/iron transport system permease protein
VLAVCATGISLLFWKEFKLHTFDRDFAAGIGYPMHILDQLLLATIVLAIVIGLRTVGVILIVSLLVCPAAAARQWTKSLSGMAALSAVFGMLSGIVGATLSAMVRNLPTGPVIALTATGFVLLSLFLAPHRGVIARALRRARNRKHLHPPDASLPVGSEL